MHIRSKIAATAAVLTLPLAGAGLSLAATSAWASSAGCAFSNGCATLHGTDASGNTVAMDAKYQKATEIVIGYPDNAGDGATSFDGVLHYTRATSQTVWADTEVFPASKPTTSDPASPVTIADITDDAAAGTWSFNVSGGSAPYTAVIGGLPGASVTSPIQAAPTATPAADNATFTVNGDNLAPGLYDDVTLTLTDSATTTPDTVTFTIALRVFAHQVTIPGGNTPFYTFVYAKGGVWSNQCVTDANGSGALRMVKCTLGHDTGQDFTVDSASGLLGSGQAHVSDLLAAAVDKASSCLTDPSTSAPATPQTDAADEQPPGGRQLYVNGSCAAGANLWDWGT